LYFFKYSAKFEKFKGRNGFNNFLLSNEEIMGNNFVSSMIWKGNITGESELLLLLEVEYV